MNWGWSESCLLGASRRIRATAPETASTGRRPGSSLRPGSRGGAGSEVASADAATAAAAALLEEQERQQCEQAQAQRPLVPQKRLGEGDGDIRTGGGEGDSNIEGDNGGNDAIQNRGVAQGTRELSNQPQHRLQQEHSRSALVPSSEGKAKKGSYGQVQSQEHQQQQVGCLNVLLKSWLKTTI